MSCLNTAVTDIKMEGVKLAMPCVFCLVVLHKLARMEIRMRSTILFLSLAFIVFSCEVGEGLPVVDLGFGI